MTVSGTHLLDAAGKAIRLIGVDMSAQSSCLNGHTVSSVPLDWASSQALTSWHVNAVRIDLNEDCWLGINGVKAQTSGVTYQAAIERWVATLNAAGIVAILDLGFSAPGSMLATGAWPLPDEDHAPVFWADVARAFAPDPGVIFDLFNEPYVGYTNVTAADWSCWLNGCVNSTPVSATASSPSNGLLVPYQTAGVQQLVDVVRASGARQPLMLGGPFWSGDPCGFREAGLHGTCPEITYLPDDPLHQLIVDFHTYRPNSACQGPVCWDDTLAGIARAGLPVLTGEFGEKDCSASFMNAYMHWADQHDVSYLAWTWDVNTSAPCVVGNGRSNHFLLGSWTGEPTTMAPDGAAFRAHLAAVYQEAAAGLEQAGHLRRAP